MPPCGHAGLFLFAVASLSVALFSASWRRPGWQPAPDGLEGHRLLLQHSADLEQSEAGRALAEEEGSPYTWVAVNRQAGFGPRYAHAAVMTADQKIFVIGGASGDLNEGKYLNDVWVSEDQGKSWSVVVPRSPRFSPRRGHAVVLDPRGVIFIVLGGFCGKACLANDCWTSETGAVWNPLGDAPWSQRHGHAAVMTSEGWLIMLGGHDGSKYLSDVWKITNPAQAESRGSWLPVTPKAEWMPRYGHAVAMSKEDAIYLLGGFYADKATGHVQCFNDVWISSDHGSTWQVRTKNAPWSGRYQHTAQIDNGGDVFVTGGLSVNLERCGDVWRSTDGGRTWKIVTSTAAWAARYEHAAVVNHNNTMYVLAGISAGSDAFSDVWRSEQTCADSVAVQCTGAEPVCMDGTQKNFKGLTAPVCVGICDRRIFDDCSVKEVCVVRNESARCVDPCKHQECKAQEVCEVAPRGEDFRGEHLSAAKAYCLSCSDAKTKRSCGLLRQCKWSTGDEACLMRCGVLSTEDRCGGNDKCKWTDGKCKSK